MNKTSKILLALIILCVTFVLGFKLGGYRGFQQGYDEGYRYDCKEEIAAIYKRVKSNSKYLDVTNKKIRQVWRENDSLKNKEMYWRIGKKQKDEEKEYLRQYSEDSVKYSGRVRKYNDSLSKVYGVVNPILPNGRVNAGFCMVKGKNAPECRPGWHIEQTIKKGRK